MTEEKNGLSHGSPNSEMAPQEDGTKVPLTDEPGQVKFSSNNPNGDAKIDIADGQTFSGLSKDELMKYADDPFWVRLRWALFIFFWAGWLAMLVMAIVIIVQAPRCAPKETLDWVQESAIVQIEVKNPVDANADGLTNTEDLHALAEALGVSTVYLEDLISTVDFEKINMIYDGTEVEAVLQAAREKGLNVVTDFVEKTVPEQNTWYQSNESDLFIPGTRDLDFSSETLLNKFIALFSTTWKDRGVLGYLIGDPAPVEETLVNASITITEGLSDVDGSVVYGLTDVNRELNAFTPESYKDFLEQHIDDWSYYKFNPKQAGSALGSQAKAKLVTMSLFLVPGTPILYGIEQDYFEADSSFIRSLSEFREKESVQVGDMTFANTTSEDVIAYARVMKGTPGCAVAVNFHPDNSTEVDFKGIKGVPNTGDVHIQVTNNTYTSGELGRVDLSSVVLQPLEGVVVLFVPSLD